jgi:hypothetical protein
VGPRPSGCVQEQREVRCRDADRRGNGLYRINLFDPETETWAPRPEGCHRAGWAAAPAGDPYFKVLFASLYEAFFNDPTNAAKKEALYFMPGCNPITGGQRKR